MAMEYMICQGSRTLPAIHSEGSVIWRAGRFSAPIGWNNWAHLEFISMGHLASERHARKIIVGKLEQCIHNEHQAGVSQW